RAGNMKAAFAVALKKLDLIVAPTVGYDVEVPLPAEIAEHDPVRMRVGMHIDGRSRCWTKSSLAIAEQNGDVGRLMIGDDQVGMTIAIHVPDRDVVGKMSGGKR